MPDAALIALAIVNGTVAYWLTVPAVAAVVRGGRLTRQHLILNGAALSTFIVCLVLLAVR